jgi:signal peptidase II
MRPFLKRSASVALLVLLLDELVKSVARSTLQPCSTTPITQCDRFALVGPLWLVRTANAGSALGFRQGWWVWVLLAAVGVLLIPLYARWLRVTGWVAVMGVGLQVGGALGNLLDRLISGGASDVLYIGGAVTWNLADIALAVGTALATWALLRSRLAKSTTNMATAG